MNGSVVGLCHLFVQHYVYHAAQAKQSNIDHDRILIETAFFLLKTYGINLLVLPGNDFDIPPEFYNGTSDQHTHTTADSIHRAQFEKALIQAAATLGIPVFGICGGMQLIAVIHGASMRLHLPNHNKYDAGIDYADQLIRVCNRPGSEYFQMILYAIKRLLIQHDYVTQAQVNTHENLMHFIAINHEHFRDKLWFCLNDININTMQHNGINAIESFVIPVNCEHHQGIVMNHDSELAFEVVAHDPCDNNPEIIEGRLYSGTQSHPGYIHANASEFLGTAKMIATTYLQQKLAYATQHHLKQQLQPNLLNNPPKAPIQGRTSHISDIS